MKSKTKMTFEELLAAHKKAAGTRRHRSEEEHRIQSACVRWFSLKYPKLRGRLFAVPNGGRRDQTTAGKLKAEGVVPGVSDLILLKSNQCYGAFAYRDENIYGKAARKPKTMGTNSLRRWRIQVCDMPFV